MFEVENHMDIMMQHIAASKGSVECILRLLDFGAHPNRKDSEGNVPL